MRPRTTFTLPADAEAAEPPEARGLARDEVRLLVAGPDGVAHTRFRDLPRFLRPGDLMVVNTSATLPAAVDGRRVDGSAVVVHVVSPAAPPLVRTIQADAVVPRWVIELRDPDGSGPVLDADSDEVLSLPGGVRLTLVAPADARPTGVRLWTALVALERPGGVDPVPAWLARYGRPISYGYLRGRWPLADYQPVFAREPGSAEMASAGRPFTDRMVTELVTRGVGLAPVLLHSGVSSPDIGEGPQTERFRVPPETARQVDLVRRTGGRVVAVGTTVARALESAVGPDGAPVAAEGWTDVVIGPVHPARVVTGLVTGWHTPDASHLLLLEAVAGPALVRAAYEAAVAERYRWHEFGDSCLLLP